MAYENFQNDYIEVDTAGYLTLATTKITVATIGNTVAYVYKDFTADHFNALDVDVEMKVLSTSTAGRYGGVCFTQTVISNVGSFGLYDVFHGNSYQTATSYIWLWRAGVVSFDYWTAAVNDTVYYTTITRVADNDALGVDIYDDSARTNLKDSLAISGFSTNKWRYFHGFNRWTTYSYNINGYIDNVNLNEAAAGPAGLKSVNGIATASIKSINGVLIANIKSINGIT